jgi:hypothetical protein
MTINYIHATARCGHICFLKIFLHGPNFGKDYINHAADELFIPSTLWTEEARFVRHCVFNIHDTHTWAQDIVCYRQAWISIPLNVTFGLISSGHSRGPLCPNIHVACSTSGFSGTVSLGLLEEPPLAVWKSSWFQHEGSPAHYGTRSGSV